MMGPGGRAGGGDMAASTVEEGLVGGDATEDEAGQVGGGHGGWRMDEGWTRDGRGRGSEGVGSAIDGTMEGGKGWKAGGGRWLALLGHRIHGVEFFFLGGGKLNISQCRKLKAS